MSYNFARMSSECDIDRFATRPVYPIAWHNQTLPLNRLRVININVNMNKSWKLSISCHATPSPANKSVESTCLGQYVYAPPVGYGAEPRPPSVFL